MKTSRKNGHILHFSIENHGIEEEFVSPRPISALRLALKSLFLPGCPSFLRKMQEKGGKLSIFD